MSRHGSANKHDSTAEALGLRTLEDFAMPALFHNTPKPRKQPLISLLTSPFEDSAARSLPKPSKDLFSELLGSDHKFVSPFSKPRDMQRGDMLSSNGLGSSTAEKERKPAGDR